MKSIHDMQYVLKSQRQRKLPENQQQLHYMQLFSALRSCDFFWTWYCKEYFSLHLREGLNVCDRDCTLNFECCKLIKCIKLFYVYSVSHIDKKGH